MRFYSGELGRWVNRDPIGEEGFRLSISWSWLRSTGNEVHEALISEQFGVKLQNAANGKYSLIAVGPSCSGRWDSRDRIKDELLKVQVDVQKIFQKLRNFSWTIRFRLASSSDAEEEVHTTLRIHALYLELVSADQKLNSLTWVDKSLFKALISFEEKYEPLFGKLSGAAAVTQGLLAPLNLRYSFVKNSVINEIDLLGLALCAAAGTADSPQCIPAGCFALYAGPGPGQTNCVGKCQPSTTWSNCVECDCVPDCQ